MRDAQMQMIEAAATACERNLWLASTYDKAGQFADAADCFFAAEHEAEFAFTVAADQHGVL